MTVNSGPDTAIAVLPANAVVLSFEELGGQLYAAADSGARVVVLRLGGGEPLQREWSDEQFLWLERFPLPTLAALAGEVAGHALDVALACDIRVASESAELRFRTIGTRRMMQLLGMERSVGVLEARGRVDAAAALRLGLVSHVAPDAEFDSYVEKLAGTIAARGPIATRLAKEAIWRGLALPLEQALRFETDLTLLLQTTKDRAEGVRAFLEKRTPQFTGK